MAAVVIGTLAFAAPKAVLDSKALDGPQLQAIITAMALVQKECFAGLRVDECECLKKPSSLTLEIKPTKTAVLLLIYPNESCFAAEEPPHVGLALRIERSTGAIVDSARNSKVSRVFDATK